MGNQNSFVIKGDIVYTAQREAFTSSPDSYLVCEDGMVAGVYGTLPARYNALPVKDYTGKLVIPGLVDMHMHAPQYPFHGTAMDKELLDWLNSQTFPEEAKYSKLTYAEKAYGIFVEEMKNGATTRAGVYATLHLPATLLLMDMLDAAGLATMVGKINMDRNCPENLCEESAEKSLEDTRAWLKAVGERSYKTTRPILTPRFIPACTDALLDGVAAIQKETGLPVQSHLSENPSECAWVQELVPESTSYSDAYARFGLFGGENCPTVMGHCVYVNDDEMELMRERGVFAAHCPVSNVHLSSGIAPVRTFLEKGVPVGLGTDIAGGFSPSMFRVMVETVQCSKLYWRLVDDTKKPLTVPEAFYLGTKGGGAFFGRVGSFEEGYEFDAVVLDDQNLPVPFEVDPVERLERIIYLSDDRNIQHKFVRGVQVK